MNKNGLDEMQIQERNRIGNQSFLLLLYLLLADAGLYGFGFRWAPYPANIMTILGVCATIYTVRLIRNNAYIGPSRPSEPPKKNARNMLAQIIGCVFIALLLAVILVKSGILTLSQVEEMGDDGAILLLLVSIIALVILAVTATIRKRQNSDDEEKAKKDE